MSYHPRYPRFYPPHQSVNYELRIINYEFRDHPFIRVIRDPITHKNK